MQLLSVNPNSYATEVRRWCCSADFEKVIQPHRLIWNPFSKRELLFFSNKFLPWAALSFMPFCVDLKSVCL